MKRYFTLRICFKIDLAAEFVWEILGKSRQKLISILKVMSFLPDSLLASQLSFMTISQQITEGLNITKLFLNDGKPYHWRISIFAKFYRYSSTL